MKLRIRAGVPNDDNRDYVPLEIKGTDMTVNENGNNSQVYPERLTEHTEELLAGEKDTWFEYVPASYDGSESVLLVVSCHGGMMNGWAQAVYSSWTMLSDREGFICVFPSAHTPGAWVVQGMGKFFHAHPAPGLPLPPLDPDDYHENYDMNFVNKLIDRMEQTYNIDPGRIFIQGMSMGHGMADQMARYYGYRFAGMAGSAGGSSGDLHYDESEDHGKWTGEVPMWMVQPERNSGDPSVSKGANALKIMKEGYWAKTNAVYGLPKIRIQGEHNFAFYKGEKADFTFHDVKNRDHGQTLDEAFTYWDYMFSGLRRNPDGTITKTETKKAPEGDAFAFAVTPGSKKAWFKNEVTEMPASALHWTKLKYHGLNGGSESRGEYITVPLRFLAEVFGASYETANHGAEATLVLPDGRHVQFARGVIGCVIDDELVSMYCETLEREGELLVSVEWFCRYLFNLNVSVCNDCCYVTDHFAELSTGMAAIIKDILA